MRRFLPLLLLAVLLGGCTVAGDVRTPVDLPVSMAGTVPVAIAEPGASWECTPLNPLSRELPANPCFRALLSGENKITLEWRVVNALPQVYIYDDFGGIADIGFKPAVCESEPQHTCSTSVRVKTGGYGRWLLGVNSPDGTPLHVAASIYVPAPFPPKDVYGGGFVDMLAPTERTISWIADPRNAPCEAIEKNAWIERGGSIVFESKARYPRCGRGARITIPAASLSEPGFRNIRIRDCHFPAGSDTEICSPYVSIGFQIDADRFLDTNPIYTNSGNDLTIRFTSESGDVRRLQSSTLIPAQNGQTFLETRESSIKIDGALLTPGVHSVELMSCLKASGKCSPGTTLLVLVDSDVDWILGRDYTEDFLSAVGHDVLGPGQPLDISYDTRGGIWLINEFSNAVEYLSPAGIASSVTVPLARNRLSTTSAYPPVKPFAAYDRINKLRPTYISTLGERVALGDSRIWFTQGGGMAGPVDIANHSRIVAYDPASTDSPATSFDDRLCVYNVPADDPQQFGNNQVIGLAATPGRIWIGESRSLFDNEPSAISSFVPDPESCENLLNFDEPGALASQSLQYCKSGQTPEQDACMEKFLLESLPPGFKVAHLAADPNDNTLWFTDARGGYLGHLDPEREPMARIYPLPETPEDDFAENIPGFGGFPWSLRVDDGAVYFSEYSTRHILRFDKATSTFDEIWIPVATSQVVLHSVDIDAVTQRLWFTLANEASVPLDKAASTIGYIDLLSWQNHVADRVRYETISGVIYKGLDRLPAASARPDQHQSFRGIAIDPASGKIALANMRRKQIVELTPNASFRP
jgi:hypothetical protein